MIDSEFIERWIPDDTENKYEQRYKELIEKVKKEISEDRTLKIETFKRIYRWKTRDRSKGHLNLKNYELYEKAITSLLSKIEENKKIKNLTDLNGIRFAVASTILHFIFPEDFPILDVRTANTLWDKRVLIKKLGDNLKDYLLYRDSILKIREKCKIFSLRQIDRSLFTYNEKKQGLFRMIEERNKLNIHDIENKLKISHKLTEELIFDLKNEFQEKIKVLRELKV